MSDSFNCRTLSKEDEDKVRQLVELTFPIFSEGKFWDWKFLQNPSSDPSFVAVAKAAGKIVGCNHWLPRKVKLSHSIAVDSMLGANIVVIPEYRKKGVGRALIHFLRTQHCDKKPPLMYMFADPGLQRHFHARVGGYIPVPNGTVLYRRMLNWNKVKINTEDFNERVKRGEFKDQLAGVDLTVGFKMHGAPPLCMHLNSKGVEVGDSAKSVDVTITSDMTTFSRLKDEEVGVRRLIWWWLTGKLRFKGSLRKILEAYRNIWVFKKILSTKIT